MPYTLRIVNRLSSDDGSMVDVPLSCGKLRAYIAAWTVHLATGKDVALLETRTIFGKPAPWPLLILE